MDIVIGVDPGASGYICTLAPKVGEAIFTPNSAKPKEIFEHIIQVKDDYSVNRVCIEDVHSLFGMSAKSNFSFGYNVGILYGIFQSAGYGIDIVTPKVWQKYVGATLKPIDNSLSPSEKKKMKAVRKRQIKESVGSVCERLYPDINIRGSKGGLLDGKSDALMIAHYAYKSSV